jgi:preprotein translocase SecE subunit
MAKSRAQRKEEARRRREKAQAAGDVESEAQHRTQVPESGDVAEVEAAMEAGAAAADQPAGPAPSRADVGRPSDSQSAESAEERKASRREERRQRKEEAERQKAQLERRTRKERAPEKQRGPVLGFFASVRQELSKVQWPDRDTLVQASAVTLLFVAVAAAYLGVLDAIFSRLVDLLI